MKTKLLSLIAAVLFLAACGSGLDPELELYSGIENGYKYVDMGGGVMWAQVNLGASMIGEYGDYYAWGETETKDYFWYNTYKYCEGRQNTLTKYCTNPSEGKVDSLTTLELEDDAAHVQWGGNWRIPTREEWIELRNTCTWTYTRENGIKGWKATAPNGNCIFFPLGGGCMFNENETINHVGYYRSSSLGEKYSESTYIVIMRTDEVTWSNGSRQGGLSIRPVCTIVK